MVESIEQCQLIEEDGAEGEALGADEAARRHRAVGVEDTLELAVEVLDRERAQLVEDPPDLDPVVSTRIGATAGGD